MAPDERPAVDDPAIAAGRTTTAVDIAIAADDSAIAACHPVMVQLRPHLDQAAFVTQVRRQQQEGYQLAYLASGGQIRSAAGFRVLTLLSSGRTFYIDDLVTDEASRSQGYGDALFDWLVHRARRAGCATLSLDSGTQRHAAHRFYFRQRMAVTSFRFVLPLAAE